MRKPLLVICIFLAVLSIAAKKEFEDLNSGDAGDGYTYRSITIRNDEFADLEMLGEMENLSGKKKAVAGFDVSFYDADEEVIGSDFFVIMNFKNDSKRTFKTPIYGVPLNKIASYKIDFIG